MNEAAANSAPRGAPGSMRELLRVALPLVISSGSASLMYVMNRVFLTWYSTDAVAAALPASVLHWTLISLFNGTVGYVNTFVAQYDGAGEPHRIGAVLWQGVYLSLLAGVALLGLIPLAPLLFDWFGHEPAIRGLETDFFQVICLGAFPLLAQTTLACFFSGREQTKVIMWVNLAATAINAALDYLLIFGIGGFPRMGIAGAATATVIAWTFAALAYVAAIYFHRDRAAYAIASSWRFDPALFARLLRFGFPNGAQFFAEMVGWTIFIQMVARLGSQPLAATSLAFNLNTLVFIPLFGMGSAVMTITGQRIGDGRPELAPPTTWKAIGLSMGYVAFFAAIYVFAPGLVMRPFALGDNPEEFRAIEPYVKQLLLFVAVYTPFDAMAIIFSAATRGAGDTRFSFWYSVAVTMLVLVLPTYIADRLGNRGLTIPWTAVTACVMVLGFGFLWQFHQGRWKTMRVIEDHAAAPLK